MLIAIICACIIGGMWWRTQSKVKELKKDIKQLQFKKVEETAVNFFAKDVNERITLLAKDMIEMQTTVSNLVYRTNSNRLIKNLGLKPKSKKK